MNLPRSLFYGGICSVALLVQSVSLAQEEVEDSIPDQIRASATAFKQAFDKHNAKALAKMWTEDGEYVDENGQRFSGREAIANEYASYFATNPDARIQLAIDAIRVINENTVLEEGRASVTPTANQPPSASRYLVIHVRDDEGWLMASVRDQEVTVPSTYAKLQDLEWLVGEWSAEHEGLEAKVRCHWVAQKSFLERTFEVRQNGQLISESREIIGWDPLQSQVVSWTFMSGGGRSMGTWTQETDGWIVQQEGVTADGSTTAAINIWSPLGDGAIGWRSVARTQDGQLLENVRDVVLRRQENK